MMAEDALKAAIAAILATTQVVRGAAARAATAKG
jgi:hypothetical protein